MKFTTFVETKNIMDKETTKATIEISKEVSEKIKSVQAQLKEKGISASIASIISNFLENEKDNIYFKVEL